MADCFEAIRKLYDKAEIPDEVIVGVIDDLEKIKSTLQERGELDKLPGRTQRYLESLKNLTSQQRLERAQNISKKSSLVSRIQAFDNKKEGILSALANSEVLLPDARVSAEGIARAQKGRLLKMFSLGLEREGLMDIAKSGGLDAEIAEAKLALEDKNYKPTIKITDEAMKIAKIYHAVTKEILESKRNAGVNVGEIAGWLKQTHDPKSLRDAGFDKWAADIVPRLDANKTFGDVSPNSKEGVEKLKGIYDKITEGRYGFIENAPVADDLVTVFKTSRLGDKLGRERTLHFKDGVSFADYNSQYGKGSIFDSMAKEIDASSRQVGLISVFGTDPEKTIEALIKQHGVENSDAKKIRDVYKVLQGFSSQGGEAIAARVGNGIRATQNLAKLGMAVASSFGDWATSAAVTRANFGGGYMGHMAGLMRNYLEAMPKEARQKWADRMGLYLDDMVSQIHANNDFGGTLPGSVSELQRLSFKASGLELHTSAGRLAAARQFSMNLAEHSGKEFGTLSPRLQANLGLYGIKEGDWRIMSQAVEDIHGYKGMTPEALDELPDAVFKSEIAKLEGRKPSLENYKRDVSNKLRNFLSDNAELAVPQPGARVKARLLGDTTQDTPEGQFWRFVAQFKSFPLTFHQVFSRVALADPERTTQKMTEAIFKGKGDVQGMVGLILTTTMLGFVAAKAKEFARTGTIDTTPTTDDIYKAAVQGGGFGLYGDFLFGEHNNTYGTNGAEKIAKTIAGPVISEAYDVGKTYYNAKSDILKKGGVSKQTTKDMIKIAQRNTPFGNMFWSKHVLDKYIWDQMYEAADPGYSLRKENRLARQRGGP